MYYSYVELEHYALVFLANQNTPERPLAPVCSEFDTKDQLVCGRVAGVSHALSLAILVLRLDQLIQLSVSC